MLHHTVLRVVSKLLIPVIMLFALYVQFHGDYSPGGGFQAGVIFAAALILYALIYGLDSLDEVCPPRVLELAMVAGVLLYGGTGVLCMALGGNFLDYNVLGHGHHGQHYGILLVEAGVGIAVASTMTVLYTHFADRGRARESA